MANDIYEYIETGLTSLMSPRAAKRMLHGALRAKGYRPQSLTAGQMHSALGPLGQDLKRLLPGEAVDRHLQLLSRQLEQRFGASEPATSPDVQPAEGAPPMLLELVLPETVSPDALMPDALTPDALSSDALSAGVLSVGTAPAEAADDDPTAERRSAEAPGLEPLSVEVTVLENPVSETLTSETPVAETPVAEAPVAEMRVSEMPAAAGPEPLADAQRPEPVRAAPSAAHPDWSPEALERSVLAFAQIEGVRMVALVSAQGALQSVRGSGFEMSALSRLGSLGLKLLSRGGQLRSFYVAQERGHLFLFPLGTALLLVVGHPEVNLGQVFATLATLKEDV